MSIKISKNEMFKRHEFFQCSLLFLINNYLETNILTNIFLKKTSLEFTKTTILSSLTDTLNLLKSK